MKKFFLVAMMALVSVAFVNAQPRSIGANLGADLGFSYQHGFGEQNMLDVAVSIPAWLGLSGKVTYDWIDPFNAPVPWNEKGEWHWYMGVGGGVGMYGFNDIDWFAGVAGHIGIEYDFWFPMQLSLDWRPTIGVTSLGYETVGFDLWGLYGLSLGIRYLF